MKRKVAVAGIGELLWDVFPDHRRMGGAPANFACHCGRLGATAFPVSCVGADSAGRQIREQLDKMDLNSAYVFETPEYPTGTVQVVLDDAGKPRYEIRENVAWDHIPDSEPLRKTAGTLDAVCFGSLAQRSEESRRTIQSFVSNTPETALRIFDVNLRQTFYSKQLAQESLQLANILKLSDEELSVLAGYFELSGSVTEQLNALRDRFGLKLIAYTRGPDGSLLIGERETDDFPGCEGRAVDSVGAGDSFTAALCMGLLRKWPLETVNRFANEVATFVCSQPGATPVLPAYLTAYRPEK